MALPLPLTSSITIMSNGYATDSSSGSNKRARFDDSDDLSAASGGAKPPPESIKQKTPLGLALSKIERFGTSSLHKAMQPTVIKAGSDFTRKYAKWNHKFQSYLKQKNNPDFIPHDARFKLELHPVKSLEGRQGFLDACSESAEVVKKCQLLLREPVLKVTKLNADELLIDAQKAYCKCLPDIIELLIAEEDISYDKHQAVADFIDWGRDDCLDFIKLRESTFVALYVEVHSLDNFPTPKRNQQQLDEYNYRRNAQGGGNNNANPQNLTNNSGGSVVVSQQTPSASRGRGRGAGNNQRSTQNGPSGSAQSSNPQQQQQQQRNATNANATSLATAAAATPAPAAAAAASAIVGTPNNNEDEQATRVIESLLSTSNRATYDTLSDEQKAMMLELLEVQQNVRSDISQEIGTSPGGATNSETTTAIQNINQPNGGGDESMEVDATPNIQNGNNIAPSGFTTALEVHNWAQKSAIANQLAKIVKGSFKTPLLVYHHQLDANAKALRIKKVATKQRVVAQANATVAAMEQEAKVDPKYVRVMIQEDVKKEVKEALAKEKGKNANATQPAKNKSSGATGGAAQKNKKSSPANSNPTAKGNRKNQQGKGNDSKGGNGSDGRPSSKKKSKKRNKTPKKKRNKSPGASNRK